MLFAHHIFAAMRVEGGEKRKSAELPKEQTPANSRFCPMPQGIIAK